MADLFDGYMEMDALADFLVSNAPTTKRPEAVPPIVRNASVSNDSTPPPDPRADRSSQWYASPEHCSLSHIDGYQSCRISVRHGSTGKLTTETRTHQKSFRLYCL
jgi:hypothetical protein